MKNKTLLTSALILSILVFFVLVILSYGILSTDSSFVSGGLTPPPGRTTISSQSKPKSASVSKGTKPTDTNTVTRCYGSCLGDNDPNKPYGVGYTCWGHSNPSQCYRCGSDGIFSESSPSVCGGGSGGHLCSVTAVCGAVAEPRDFGCGTGRPRELLRKNDKGITVVDVFSCPLGQAVVLDCDRSKLSVLLNPQCSQATQYFRCEPSSKCTIPATILPTELPEGGAQSAQSWMIDIYNYFVTQNN